MKVLYALWNYPQYSETYIAAEISYALRSGVEVEVWSMECRHPAIKPPVKVHRGSLADAIAAAKPDIIHIHYLVYTLQVIDQIPERLPVTVRGHSFDWDLGRLDTVSKIRKVKKIFLFPHFAALTKNKKAIALPVAYDSRLHVPSHEKDGRQVIRLAAGLPTKGLMKIFAIAKGCPDHKFTLVLSSAGGAEGFAQSVAESKERPENVEVLSDISEVDAVRRNAEAGIYLDTYDPAGHAFGMPISIVEAMATGSFVLAERHPDAIGYVGTGGMMYHDVNEAIRMIRDSESFMPTAWTALAGNAMDWAKKFQDKNVLPVLIEEWKRLL